MLSTSRMGRCRYDVSTVGNVSAMPVHGLSVHARMIVGTDSSAACVATMLHKTIMQRQIRRNMCLKVFNCSNFRNFPNLQLGCKGTTKNAHLQTKLRKVYFQRNFVCKWAALCDRSFGGIVPWHKAASEGTTVSLNARA